MCIRDSSAIANSPKSVRIYPERTAEAKILRLRPWLKGCILLPELGYFKYLFFGRIDLYGGYFVSRLKGNANRYTHLRWAKVFTEQADRLLTEILECVGLKLDILTLYNIYLCQGCEPNVKRKRLMDRWVT